MTQAMEAVQAPIEQANHQSNAFERARDWLHEKWLPVAMVVGLAVGSVACSNEGNSISVNRSNNDKTEQTTPEECADTWEIDQLEHTDGAQIIAEGVPEIRAAETEED